MKGHFRGQSLEQRCSWRMTRDRYIWFCYALEIPRYHFPLLIHIRMRINFIIISAGHTVLMEISHGTVCLDSPSRSCNCTYMRNVMFLPEVKMSWNSLYEFFFFSFFFWSNFKKISLFSHWIIQKFSICMLQVSIEPSIFFPSKSHNSGALSMFLSPRPFSKEQVWNGDKLLHGIVWKVPD